MIKVTDLQFLYTDHLQLHISDWQVFKGQQLFLYGSSGSGKSTLLQLLAGLLQPSQGLIEINKQRIDLLSPRQMDHLRARSIGFISQDLNLIPYLTVFENILLAAQFSHFDRSLNQSELHKKIKSLLTQVNITPELQARKSMHLSAGQQQRVAIVRALIHNPEIILADEPTSALDSQNKDQFMALLMELCGRLETTLVMVSHDLSLRSYFEYQQAISDFSYLEYR